MYSWRRVASSTSFLPGGNILTDGFICYIIENHSGGGFTFRDNTVIGGMASSSASVIIPRVVAGFTLQRGKKEIIFCLLALKRKTRERRKEVEKTAMYIFDRRPMCILPVCFLYKGMKKRNSRFFEKV